MRTSITTDVEGHRMNLPDDIAHRRAAAVKTAWGLAVVACLIFLAFILSGVLKH